MDALLNLGWPQWTLLALWFLALLLHATRHGEPITSVVFERDRHGEIVKKVEGIRYNIYAKIVWMVFVFVLLLAGGFFR